MQNSKRKFNFKRFFQVLLLVLILIPSSLMLSSCSLSLKTSVVSIEETGTVGTSTIFTVTYSNGETSTFSIESGEDGEDLTIESIFEYCVSLGLYSNDTDGFTEFLADYLTVEADTDDDLTTASYTAIKSAVSVYSFFPVAQYTTTGHGLSASYTFSYYAFAAGTGSGVVYLMGETYSYIITCYHVVYDTSSATEDGIASQIFLFQYGTTVSYDATATSTNESVYPTATSSTGIPATYIGGALQYDIAVLQVATADLASWTQAITVATDYSLAETVIAVGNPEAEGFSVTSGIVNVYSEYIELTIDGTNYYYYRVLRIDAGVNSGNSGGGLFNAKGEFVGIVNAKAMYSNDGTYLDNMSYALPVDNVIKVANNILDNYTANGEAIGVTTVATGLTTSEANSSSVLNTDGTLTIVADCLVTDVAEDYLAETLGLQANDIITKITINSVDYEITRDYMLTETLLLAREGDTIIFTYTRDEVENLTTTSHTLESTDFYIFY